MMIFAWPVPTALMDPSALTVIMFVLLLSNVISFRLSGCVV